MSKKQFSTAVVALVSVISIAQASTYRVNQVEISGGTLGGRVLEMPNSDFLVIDSANEKAIEKDLGHTGAENFFHALLKGQSPSLISKSFSAEKRSSIRKVLALYAGKLAKADSAERD